ncbi:lipase family protein [Williamsia sp. CHRR-6]|uniref:lipase family protein n=1 Tax=Williamsia sp. CHRR-6 TaxID=2835871 RepID=UPI001BD99F2B|nr:lipase family protein [Williamsia sp. CHRR-6]MBT0566516.1 lipase [Williamsia sp. CHRR-6]
MVGAVLLSGVLGAGLLAGCASSDSGAGRSTAGSAAANSSAPDSSVPGSPSGAALPPAPSPAERGQVLARTAFTPQAGGTLARAVADGATITRIVYRSTAGYAPGDPSGSFGTAVSGIVAVPPGSAPPGGWPIVTYGHGTTGTAPDCGPSVHPDLLGYDGQVASLLDAGYVVAASDYQGLGRPDALLPRGIGGSADATQPHPYINAATVAYNMIDMVRAARVVAPAAGDRWAALGVSQGGQAAWAAADRAADYGSGLRFVGAAALAPAADISPIAAGYDARPYVAPGYTLFQLAFIPVLVDGLRAVYPDLRVGDYVRGGLAANAAKLTTCGPNSFADKAAALSAFRPGDAAITSPAALRTLHDMLAAQALPTRRAGGPLFVAYGDADEIITSAWTTAAVRRACAQGDVIDSALVRGRGHSNLGQGPAAVGWIGDRFAGRPARSTCAVA